MSLLHKELLNIQVTLNINSYDEYTLLEIDVENLYTMNVVMQQFELPESYKTQIHLHYLEHKLLFQKSNTHILQLIKGNNDACVVDGFIFIVTFQVLLLFVFVCY